MRSVKTNYSFISTQFIDIYVVYGVIWRSWDSLSCNRSAFEFYFKITYLIHSPVPASSLLTHREISLCCCKQLIVDFNTFENNIYQSIIFKIIANLEQISREPTTSPHPSPIKMGHNKDDSECGPLDLIVWIRIEEKFQRFDIERPWDRSIWLCSQFWRLQNLNIVNIVSVAFCLPVPSTEVSDKPSPKSLIYSTLL